METIYINKNKELLLSEISSGEIFGEDLLQRILKFEEIMLSLPQVEVPINHHFSPGIYIREMCAPKDTFICGEVHKTEHLVLVIKGEISVLTNDGKGLRRIKAPHTFVSKPGMKRVGYTHEDTVWMNIHPTKETELSKIEEEIFDRPLNIEAGESLCPA